MTTQPFQFAVLRYIHDPITEEFLNIGIVVYSRENRYLRGKISKQHLRVSQTFGGIHRTHYNRMTSAIVRLTAQLRRRLSKPDLFDDYPDRIEELLGEILPADPSSLMFGGYGGGLADDLDAELERLYERLVARYEQTGEPESRTDEVGW